MVSGYSFLIKWGTVISWKCSFITLSIINAHVPPFCFKSFLWEYFYNEMFPKLSSETYKTAENDNHSLRGQITKDILHFRNKNLDIVFWKPTWLNMFPMVKLENILLMNEIVRWKFCASMKTMEYSFPLHFPILPFVLKLLKQKLDLHQRFHNKGMVIINI